MLRPAISHPVLSLLILPLFALLLAPAAHAANETFYLATQAPLLEAPGGAVIATVSPGTPLHALATKGDLVQVEITGWAPEGGEKYLFTEMGQRIRLAKITPAGKAVRKVVATKEDYYETTWQDVHLTGWVAKSATTDDIASVWAQARTLFHQRCTRCHALHRPTEFKANQWPSILKIMTVRAGLSAADKALVTQYLQMHAKDQAGAAEVADDTAAAASAAPQEDPSIPKITGDAALARAGAAAFADNNCTACHGDDAKTPAIPAYPRLAGQSGDYIYKQLQDFQSGARANDEYGVMKEALNGLSDADLRAISWWLSTQ